MMAITTWPLRWPSPPSEADGGLVGKTPYDGHYNMAPRAALSTISADGGLVGKTPYGHYTMAPRFALSGLA